jgi:UMF1 family MFS transporter
MTETTAKNSKSLIRSWAMFDWANSAYNLVITTTVFPVYYTAITMTDEGGDMVDFFGFRFVNTALANYSLSVAYLLMALALPVLSAVADNTGRKKAFMQAFTYLGGTACMALFFFKPDALELGIICSSLAAMGYIGGVLFNNSYLPLIAAPDRQDRASAQGFAYGYIGSVLLQLICFVFILQPEWFGITDSTFGPRLSFLLVGIWWIAFSQIPFRRLPETAASARKSSAGIFKQGFFELRTVWHRVRRMPVLKRFLMAFFFYAMGVQTIMLVAAAFGEKVLQLGQAKLIATILVIQLVAIGGAYLMSYLVKLFGNIPALIGMVAVWIGVCLAAYYIRSETEFYLLAVTVGLVMGGIQSISRSTYSKLLPVGETDTASFFSFYDVTEKIAIVFGLFTFAVMEELTRNMRFSALMLAVYFIIGMIFLIRILVKSSRRQVL